VRNCDGDWQGVEALAGRRVFAFAGLGRPDGLLATLAESGAEVAGSRWFPDHHRYGGRDLAEIAAAAAALSAVPVTTGKDAVKLPCDAAVWVLEAEVRPVEGSWKGLWRLLPEVLS
jgi:tetraacyldisaccharide 4'-kinase